MIDFKKLPWIKISSMAVAAFFVLLVWGCEPKAPGLTDPTQSLTRRELQIEFEMLLQTYEYRLATLEQKERFRMMLLQNASAIAQAGTINPFGIITAFLAFYGVGSAATTAKNVIKKKIIK